MQENNHISQQLLEQNKLLMEMMCGLKNENKELKEMMLEIMEENTTINANINFIKKIYTINPSKEIKKNITKKEKGLAIRNSILRAGKS